MKKFGKWSLWVAFHSRHWGLGFDVLIDPKFPGVHATIGPLWFGLRKIKS